MLKEIFGNDQLEHRVAQEFQTLIVKMIALRFMSEAGVRECLCQQKRVAKLITDTFLKRRHVFVILSEVEESLNTRSVELAAPGTARLSRLALKARFQF